MQKRAKNLSSFRSKTLQSQLICLHCPPISSHKQCAGPIKPFVLHTQMATNVMTAYYYFIQSAAASTRNVCFFTDARSARAGSICRQHRGCSSAESAPSRKRLNAAKQCKKKKNTKNSGDGRCARAHTHLQAGLERSFRRRGYLLLRELLEAPVLHEDGVNVAPDLHVSVFLLDSLDHSCHRGTVPRRTRGINAAAEDGPLHQAPRMHVRTAADSGQFMLPNADSQPVNDVEENTNPQQIHYTLHQ